MNGAATAALPLEGLPDLPCTQPVPWPTRSEVHEPTGTFSVRRCVLPDGHLERDVPCRYDWFEQHVDASPLNELGDTF